MRPRHIENKMGGGGDDGGGMGVECRSCFTVN